MGICSPAGQEKQRGQERSVQKGIIARFDADSNTSDVCRDYEFQPTRPEDLDVVKRKEKGGTFRGRHTRLTSRLQPKFLASW